MRNKHNILLPQHLEKLIKETLDSVYKPSIKENDRFPTYKDGTPRNKPRR